jgi:hypothetical protein
VLRSPGKAITADRRPDGGSRPDELPRNSTPPAQALLQQGVVGDRSSRHHEPNCAARAPPSWAMKAPSRNWRRLASEPRLSSPWLAQHRCGAGPQAICKRSRHSVSTSCAKRATGSFSPHSWSVANNRSSWASARACGNPPAPAPAGRSAQALRRRNAASPSAEGLGGAARGH